MRLRWISLVGVVVVIIAIWASDKIGWEGERTVYTARCEGGNWLDGHCTGRLVPSDRYRFRASRSRQEVMYWIVGSRVPSATYRDCTVKDRGTWSCNVGTNQPHTVTHEMINGKPEARETGSGDSFRTVPKWEWWLLRLGVRMTDTES